MGCSTSMEDKVLLTKLDRLEIQVKKEKELKKLSEMEGRQITSLGQLGRGLDTRTEIKRRMKTTPNERNFDTYTSKDKSKKKKKRNESEVKSKKKKKDKDEKSRKKRTHSEGSNKKKKKKK